MSDTKQICAALIKAQADMGAVLRNAENPHLRSKYADLTSVIDAVMPALNAAGIAVIQPALSVDGERFVDTVLLHTSGESLSCRVPLILQKNDMQGYGSAVTYARRYGLMAMTGVAPEDDDGEGAGTVGRNYGGEMKSPPSGRAGRNGNPAGRPAPSQNQSAPSDADPGTPNPAHVASAIAAIKQRSDLKALADYWTTLPREIKAAQSVIAAKDAQKTAIESPKGLEGALDDNIPF